MVPYQRKDLPRFNRMPADGIYRIMPLDINVDYKKGFKHLFNAFDNSETETSAAWLVEMAQKHGSWRPFSREEIEAVYHEHFEEDFRFNRLIRQGRGFYIMEGYRDEGGGWIVCDGDESKPGAMFHFTDDFVERCFKSSPAKR